MSTTPVCLIEGKDAENAQTTQYTSTGLKTIIDKFTVSNVTGGNLTFAVNLVPQAGAAANANRIISRSILAGQCYTCPELVGHVLEAGDFISTLASATGLTIRASGRQVTSD